MTSNNKVIGVSILVALLFVATIINFTPDNAPTRRKLTVENTNERVFANEEEMMNQLVIKPYEVLGRLPCVPEDSPNNQGIFYIKVPKTSSSTLAHVTSRMAAKESSREGYPTDQLCKTHDPMIHSSASNLKTADRDKEKSFLWTVVRHPNDRAVSHFGMRLSFGNVINNQRVFRENLVQNSSFKTNIQLAFMSTKKIKGFYT